METHSPDDYSSSKAVAVPASFSHRSPKSDTRYSPFAWRSFLSSVFLPDLAQGYDAVAYQNFPVRCDQTQTHPPHLRLLQTAHPAVMPAQSFPMPSFQKPHKEDCRYHLV